MRGKFENLEIYCIIGFKRLPKVENHIVSETDRLLVWSQEVLQSLSQSKRDRLTDQEMEEGKMELFCYLIELCYQLSLSKALDLLESTSFEKFLKLCRRGRDKQINHSKCIIIYYCCA
jgi:hypothetical protein